MKRILFIFLFISLRVFSQTPGAFDLSFGNAGKVILDVGDLDHCEDVAIDSSHNIYFAGYTTFFGTTTNTDFILGKLTPTGNVDSTFAVNGLYKGDFPKTNASTIHNIKLVNDGILLFGSGLKYGVADTQYLFVSKVLFNGMLDTTFADSGTFSGVFLTSYNYPGSMILDVHGNIIVCGSAYDSLSIQDVPLIGRLFANGNPDTTFSPTGFKFWDMTGPLQNASNIFPSMPEHGAGGFFDDVVLMDNGNYFFSGFYNSGTAIHCLMGMTDSAGVFVPNFGLNGFRIFQQQPGYSNKIVKSILYGDELVLAIQFDGLTSGVDFFLQPIDTLGNFLTTFSGDFNGQRDEVKDLEVADGNLYVGGYTTFAGNVQPGYFSDHYALAKYDNTHFLNNQFAVNGLLEEDFNTNDEAGATCFKLMDNKIIVAGFLNNVAGNNVSDFGFMCFYTNYGTKVSEYFDTPEVQFYPNPVSEKMRVQSTAIMRSLSIYGVNGQLLLNHQGEEGRQLEIDVSNFSAGIYILEIIFPNGQIERKKVVVH